MITLREKKKVNFSFSVCKVLIFVFYSLCVLLYEVDEGVELNLQKKREKE